MARTSAALFIPLFESLVLSLICYFAMYAFFSSTVAADFSPSMRSFLFCSLGLNIGTGFLVLCISAAQKSEYIVAVPASARTSFFSYRHALGVGNAHCCSSALLLLLHLCMFLQISVFGWQLDATSALPRTNGYISTQQADWMHAVVGASGGWIFSRDRNAYVVPASPVVAPFMGSIYSGIVLAYLSIMFLVSIYISYMATPDMASSYLFLEPRFLVVCSGFLAFGVGQSISGTFGTCSDPAASIAGFAAFVAATCFFDILFIPLGLRIHAAAKWLGLQAITYLAVCVHNIFYIS